MKELENNKQKEKRIKMLKMTAPIGGAIIGYLYSRGALWGYPKTPTNKQLFISVMVGTLIGFGVSYLGVKKIENEK